ncbi:hypothetical protein Dsin_031606 [Dipteronia sinensis]|uniref:Transposase MuDR plant domain-containing protein n=1 Tax=Dipteronia sinensis TaxID=43782 RepID=A0AAD9ZMS0_9ROSI|nr:hypothetical protein Dsin_031606 [Dipteronia sinensis]
MGTMDGFIVYCDRHWIDDQVMGPISFACHDDKYSKLLETICHRIEAEKDQRTPASTTKHAEAEVDDSDSFDTSDTEDESSSDGHASTDCREVETNGMFKDKKTLKGVLGFNALQKRFDYMVRESNHTQFIAICKKRDCQWVFRAGKSRNGTYWNVKSIDSEHTCGDNGNYNVDFHSVVRDLCELQR